MAKTLPQSNHAPTPKDNHLLAALPAAAGRLQSAGLIHYIRGKITVLDRSKLEARACECYAVVKREYDRLLPYEVFANSGVV